MVELLTSSITVKCITYNIIENSLITKFFMKCKHLHIISEFLMCMENTIFEVFWRKKQHQLDAIGLICDVVTCYKKGLLQGQVFVNFNKF